MQARTPIEAIQEFQVITGQYDAEFGRTTGAVVNAVIKSGTNAIRGSAFGYFQDSSLTTQGLLRQAAQPGQGRHQLPALGRRHRRADRQGPHALLRQPRAVRHRSRQHHRHPDPARPERSADDAGSRVEHDRPRRSPGLAEPHLQRALAARAVAAAEPDRPDRRPASSRPARAAREESDVDQSLAVNLNSVLSNTKVNTLRVTWTRENVTFANACYNGNGRDLAQCAADAGLPELHRPAGQHRPVPHQRRHQRRRHAGLVPARQARRPRHQGRRAVRLLGRAEREPGQPERHLRVRPEQRRTSTRPTRAPIPDRFTIRVGGPSQFYQKAHLLRRLRPGQVAADAAADAQPRPALRPRGHPDRRDRRPAASTAIRSTRTTSSRASASPTISAAARASSAAATAASSTRRTSS